MTDSRTDKTSYVGSQLFPPYGLLKLNTTPEQVFWQRVRMVNGCLVWNGPLNNDGYGMFYLGRLHMLAHRFSYSHFVGPIPAGRVLDHICRNRPCARPDHLRPVTQRQNCLENSASIQALNARKTHCKRGHPFDAGNTRPMRSRGHVGRQCIACVRACQATPEQREKDRRRHRALRARKSTEAA